MLENKKWFASIDELKKASDLYAEETGEPALAIIERIAGSDWREINTNFDFPKWLNCLKAVQELNKTE